MANNNSGVEIPVIIDIEQACKDAAARVDKAMAPIQRKISQNTLNMKITFGNGDDEVRKSIKQIREDFKAGRMSVAELAEAIEYCNNKLIQFQMGAVKTPKFETILEAKHLLVDMQNALKMASLEIDGLSNSFLGLNARLQSSRIALNNSALGSPEWKVAAQEIRKITEEMAKWELKVTQLGMASGSLEKLHSELTAIEQKYNALSKTARLGTSGEKLLQKYKQITAELEKQGKTIAQTISEEQKRNDLVQRELRNRRYETAALNNLSKTMAGLRQQAQFLQQAMDRTNPNSPKWRAYKDQLEKVNAEMQKLSGGMTSVNASMAATNATMQKQSMLLQQLKGAAGMYISVFGLFRFAKQVRDVTAELEYQRVALGHLIQDEEYGAHLFQQIKALAIESPFRIKDLVTYTKQLAAYRIETEDLYSTTKRLADISAGLGVDMNRLILAYGQVRAASVLRGQELRQFTEAGVPLVELLAEKFSILKKQMVSTADVFKLISARAVPFSMISEIFEDMTEKGGAFYEMQKVQADTLKGKWEKLKDAFDIGLQTIGESKTAKDEMDAILWIANRLAKNLQIIPKLLAAGTAAWVTWKIAVLAAAKATQFAATVEQKQIISQRLNNTELNKSIVVKLAGAKASKALTRAIIQETVATNAATRAWAKLKIALLTNPIGVVITAITALASAIFFYRQKTDELSEATQQFQKVLDETAEGMRKINMGDRLIKQYELLASKTERTAKENTLLRNTMIRLAEIYPDVKLGIDNENNSLEKQLALLRNVAKEEKERIVRRAKDEIKLQQLNLEKAQAREKEAEAERDRIAEEIRNTEKLIASKKKDLESNKNSEEVEAAMQTQLKQYERSLERLRRKANKTDKTLAEESEAVKTYTNEIERLNLIIDPEKETKKWAEWQQVLVQMSEYTFDNITGSLPSLSPDEIKNYESLHKALKQVEQSYKDTKTSADEMFKYLANAENEAKKRPWDEKMQKSVEDLRKDYQLALEQAKGLKAVLDFFGYVMSGGKGSSYQKPKFITDMEEAIKFMKDFKKGYEDLNKYMSANVALDKQSATMEYRGTVLGIDVKEQQRAATDLIGWYKEQRDKAMEEMRKAGGRGTTLKELLGMDVGKNEKLKDFQQLLLSLSDAITDLETSDALKKLEKALNDLADKVKRSELARKFYDSIFDLTGDKDMAMSMSLSVYGDTGKDLENNIRKQLEQAFVLDDKKVEEAGEGIYDVMQSVRAAIESGDYGELDKYLDYLSDANKKVAAEVLQNWQKSNHDIAKDYAALLLRFDDIAKQEIDITTRVARDRAKIEAGLALEVFGIKKKYDEKIANAENDAIAEQLEAEKNAAIQAARTRANAVIEAIEEKGKLDIKKLSSDYTDFFAQTNLLTAKHARKIRKDLRDAYYEAFHKGAISADELNKNLRAIDNQYKKLRQSTNFFVTYLEGGLDKALDETVNKFDAYSKKLDEISQKLKEGKKLSESEEAFSDNMIKKYGKMFGGDDMKGIGSFKQLIQKFSDMFGGESQGMSAAGSAFGQMGEGMSEFAATMEGMDGTIAMIDRIVKAVNATVIAWQGLIDELNRMRSEDHKIAEWHKYISDFNKYAYSGWEKLKSGDPGAAFDVVNSWITVFNNIQEDKVKKLNKRIEQQQLLLNELTYAYGRLDTAINKAFGEDYIYNYNKQLENLVAQQQAYLKQAELERSKGKSKDKDKIKDYEDKARETADKIADMQSQLSEFFTGTDLTSAAKEFAQAWLEAYKEFANTTDAMSDKFNDMIESMITRSLAAKIMQTILQPLFDQIDQMARDGDLSTTEIAEIARIAPAYVEKMNEAMTAMANDLTAAGYNLRGNSAKLTGISRDIAGASEESILGLSAAINTQNFYISNIPIMRDQLSQIIALMGGGTQGNTAVSEAPETDLKLQYLSYLPTIASDVNEILVNLKRVISPNGAHTATHYISMR